MSPAPECVALAEGLRKVRARTGLSLVALAGRTAYSKSSWERYLNGKKLAPRQAVEALCAMAGEPPGRLLALWELADAEWSGRARHTRPAVPHPPAPASPPAGGGRWVRHRRLFTIGAGVAAVAAVAVITALSAPGPGTEQPTSMASPALDPAPGCQGKTCAGKDPAHMLCGLPGRADSLGPQHRTRTGTSVEIRYSKVCDAAWGRIWHAKVGDAIEISASGARQRRVVVRNTADTGVYRFTPMVGGPDQTSLRLCFIPAGSADQQCFHS